MQQLQIIGPRQAVFREVPDPACPADGVLVRATHSAISTGTELRVYRGIPVDAGGKFLHERVPLDLPAPNGYSLVGRVEAVGPQATGFAVGERVFATAGHMQLAAVPATAALKLPDGLPDEQAAFLNILEVGHLAIRRGSPPPGADVAVVGLGVIGLSVVAYARAFGCRTVAVDPVAARRRIAADLGADLVLDPTVGDCVERAVGYCGGVGADVVVECASVWPAIELGMHIAAAQGKVVVAARHTDLPAFNPVGHPFLGKRLELLTVYGHPPPGSRWDRSRSIALTLDLLCRRRMHIAPMLTHRFTWNALPEVYRRLDAGDPEMVGIVLEWERG